MLFQEAETVELKERYTEGIKKELVAFANSNGGTLYVGVQDDGEVVGLDDIDGTSLQISNCIRDSIRPDLTMFISYRTIQVDSKQVLSVKVERGTGRPYYLASKGLRSLGVYVRQGTFSVPASESAIRKLIKENDGDVFESMRTTEQELSFSRLETEFSERRIEFGRTQMRTMGLVNGDGLYTNLALMLSDQCPHIIKAAVFRGDSPSEFQDRQEFSGSILKQLEDAYSYLNMNNRTSSVIKGLHRIDSREYPEDALREALLNAVVHRDYSNLASTFVNVYSNRVEIVSYGGLAGDITISDALNGLSVCRNRKLAEIFYRLNLIEAYGTGLIKIQNSYSDRRRRPEFIAAPCSFKVVLPNMNVEGKENYSEIVSDSDRAILKYIPRQGSASRAEIEGITGTSPATTVRQLGKLSGSGLIKVVGKGKNTRYETTYTE